MAYNQDLYGKPQQWAAAGLQTSDKMHLRVANSTVDDKGDLEFLVQNVAIQYNRPVNNIYEIGSNKVFFGPTRASGTFQIGRIVGERLITDLIGAAGTGMWNGEPSDKKDTATSSSRTMCFVSTKEGTAKLNFKLTGCIIESYGIATDANGLLIQENVSGRFASLLPSDGKK